MENLMSPKQKKQLKYMKESVAEWYRYFKDNNEYYCKMRNFVFKTTVPKDQEVALDALKRPAIGFNILEMFLSRQRGEFAKHEPDVFGRADDNTSVPPQLLDLVEGALRYSLHEANEDGFEYEIYSETSSGGYATAKVYRDYRDEFSFEQVIKMEKSFDSLLVGFDPLARKKHKGDGDFCFEIFPLTETEFKNRFENIDVKSLKFSASPSFDDFTFSYYSGNKKMILLCYFYQKRKQKLTIHNITDPIKGGTDNRGITDKEYKKLLKEWRNTYPNIAEPQIISSRTTFKTEVYRYIFIEDQILEPYDVDDNSMIEKDYGVDTESPDLPIIFFDGNSEILRESANTASKQMTRAFHHNAVGVQKLKNVAGQSIANELQNLSQVRIAMPIEAMDNNLLDIYKNPQTAHILPYQQYMDKNVDKPLKEPTIIPRPEMPMTLLNTFQMCDQAMQMCMGSFDSTLGKLEQDVSRAAFIEAATQSNAAAMPYIVNFIKCLGHLAQVAANMLPQILMNRNTMPIIDRKGEKQTVDLNAPEFERIKKYTEDGTLKYAANFIKIKVEAGVNFAIQKTRALQQIMALLPLMPRLQQILNTPEGFTYFLSNMDFKNVDKLIELNKQIADQEKKAPKQPPLPVMEIQRKMKKDQMEAQLQSQANQIEQQHVQNERAQIDLENQRAGIDAATQLKKSEAEEVRANAEVASKILGAVHIQTAEMKNQTHGHSLEIAQHLLEERKADILEDKTKLEREKFEHEKTQPKQSVKSKRIKK